MKVVITIPAYNESKTLPGVISNIQDVMKKTSYNFQVLVVDDGSTDSTRNVAESLGAVVYSHPINRGLAEAFRSEIKQCLNLKADVIVHIDADGQYRAEEIPGLLDKIEQGYDLVLASRFKGTIEYMPLLKRVGNRAFSKVISHITGFRVSDCQTGFRAFTREVAENIPIISSFTYTQEQIIRAIKQNYRLVEVPAYFVKRQGDSRLMRNPFDFAVKAWLNIFRIYRDHEPLKFFGYVGGLFLLSGFFSGLFLLYNFFTTGKVGHIPLTLLTILLIIVGIQIWLFGFLADMKR